MAKGQKEYARFKEGKSLTHKQAILAQCFVCNGSSEGGEDCNGYSCPLYPFMPYGSRKQRRCISTEKREQLLNTLSRARAKRKSSKIVS